MKKYITYEEPYVGQIFDEAGMERIYATDVDKEEYAFFDFWLWDMLRSGVFEEIKEEQVEMETDVRYYVSSIEGSHDVINAEWWFNSKKEALAFRDELREELKTGKHDKGWNLFDGLGKLTESEKAEERARVADSVDVYSYRGGKYGERI